MCWMSLHDVWMLNRPDVTKGRPPRTPRCPSIWFLKFLHTYAPKNRCKTRRSPDDGLDYLFLKSLLTKAYRETIFTAYQFCTATHASVMAIRPCLSEALPYNPGSSPHTGFLRNAHRCQIGPIYCIHRLPCLGHHQTWFRLRDCGHHGSWHFARSASFGQEDRGEPITKCRSKRDRHSSWLRCQNQ